MIDDTACAIDGRDAGVPSRGVLLIGHGTRDVAGTEQFFDLGKQLAHRMNPLPVVSALLEFQRPTIEQGWEMLIADGVQHVHVAPLLLFAAGHAKQDIPEIVQRCQSATPQVTFDQSRPISRHRAIVELTVRRLQATLDSLSGPRARVAVVMVGRGSHDPCAQADMRVLSEVVGRKIDVKATVTAFYAMAEPRLPDVLKQIAASGGYDQVIVHPHLLFEGRLFQSIITQTEQATVDYPELKWVASTYLGPDELVAHAIAARIDQASTATVARCR